MHRKSIASPGAGLLSGPTAGLLLAGGWLLTAVLVNAGTAAGATAGGRGAAG